MFLAYVTSQIFCHYYHIIVTIIVIIVITRYHLHVEYLQLYT
jgi:hypothetical protein